MTGKKKPCAVLFLHLLMMCHGIQASSSSEISTGLGKIQKTASHYDKNEAANIQQFNDFLQSPDGQSVANSLSGPISDIGNSMDGLTAGDVLEPTIAVLDIVTSISEIIPKVGPIIGIVSSILSTVLSLFGASTQESMEDVVKRVVDEVIAKYQDENIRDETYGLAKEYGTSEAYLKSLVGQKLTSNEMHALSTHIPIYRGVKFIGYLESKILAYKATNDLDSNRRAAYYLNLLIPLSALRSAILTQVYMIVLASGGQSSATANAINDVIQNDHTSNKNFLQFLAHPKYKDFSFFTSLDPAREPLITGFLHAYGLEIPYFKPLGNKYYTIQNVKYGKYMGKWSNKFYKTDKIDSNSKFKFIPMGNMGYFYIKVGNYYVVNKSGKLWTYGGKPGQDGEWKIVKFDDGNYMMTARWNYGFYAYMNSGGWIDSPWGKGDPGTSGHWRIR